MKNVISIATMLSLVFSFEALADESVAQQLIARYATIAKLQDANYAGPSAADGKAFFNREVIQFKSASNKTAKAIACASCHTANPADFGKHIATGKKIQPLSPVVNAKRFDDIEKVEKQFNKHCHEVVGSDCSASEKANYIAFLLEEKSPSAIKN
jgi:hypothetical protein